MFKEYDGTKCPKCGSKSITDGEYDWYDGDDWRFVRKCDECGEVFVEWEVMMYTTTEWNGKSQDYVSDNCPECGGEVGDWWRDDFENCYFCRCQNCGTEIYHNFVKKLDEVISMTDDTVYWKKTEQPEISI